jgi:hypothetical protein
MFELVDSSDLSRFRTLDFDMEGSWRGHCSAELKTFYMNVAS